MIDRKEVEALLAASQPGSDTFLAATDKLTRRTLGELCRTWLAVQDAPDVALPSAHDWLAATNSVASNEWQTGWDACRNRWMTLSHPEPTPHAALVEIARATYQQIGTALKEHKGDDPFVLVDPVAMLGWHGALTKIAGEGCPPALTRDAATGPDPVTATAWPYGEVK